MVSTNKLKSVDFYRKVPKDLTEASFSGAGLSIMTALVMLLLFGMELSEYLTTNTSPTIVVDNSADGEFLRIDLNISFPALSCEFASVDVSDVLGTNRLNITKTIRKISIDSNLKPIGSESNWGPSSELIKHDEEVDEEHEESAFQLTKHTFERLSLLFPILVVNFYAPWCYWSNRLKPSWEVTAKIIRERHDPERDGRILLGKVDCSEEIELCRRHHIQGYPSIRIFRAGSNVIDANGHQEHEAYYGDRDTESLVTLMETLVAPVQLEKKISENATANGDDIRRLAPPTGGCRLEGFVRVRKVPGNLLISAISHSHSFDASKMNMSHVITHFFFGKKITPWEMKDLKRIISYLGNSHDKLEGKSYISSPIDTDANVTFEHHLQIVKTEVMTKNYKLLEDYEYTAHSSMSHSLNVPLTKFSFELSPMQVVITEDTKSFSHFLTNVCAIIGGVYTVAGILDAILYNSVKLIKKVELGKNS